MAEDSDAIYRRCAAFMREFHSLTEPNPLIHRERIYKLTAAIELGCSNKAIHLSSIRTFERGKGHGSKALDWLCTLADKYGLAITGSATQYDTRIINDGISHSNESMLDFTQLKSWYVRRGFTVRALEMRREPKGFAEGPNRDSAKAS